MTNRLYLRKPPLWLSVVPVAALLLALGTIILSKGADAIADYSPWALLGSASLAVLLSWITGAAVDGT